jgi:hypothetical protein
VVALYQQADVGVGRTGAGYGIVSGTEISVGSKRRRNLEWTNEIRLFTLDNQEAAHPNFVLFSSGSRDLYTFILSGQTSSTRALTLTHPRQIHVG